MGKYQRITILILILLNCCVDPYTIKSISEQNLIVVEGYLSNEVKLHQVKLSRTSPINLAQFIPETGAQVSISGGNGSLVQLAETTPGVYQTPPMAGIIGVAYTLHITTQSGQQLVSAAVTLKDTPDIKDVYATYSPTLVVEGEPGGIQIFLDTEDPTNTVKFYRWEYEETWEIDMPFPSNFIWLGGNNVAFRTIPVGICWGGDTSRNVLIKSAQGLSEAKVTAQLIQTIPGGSTNMRVMYSILVRQYSLSQEGYLYWQTIKDINQTQGSLYDTQPGTVRGNISSLNDNSIPLGFFDAGVVKQKRAFFSPKTFYGTDYTVPGFETACNYFTPIEVHQDQIGDYLTQNPGYEIAGATGFDNPILFLLPKYCCDCTSLGTNIKPAYWP